MKHLKMIAIVSGIALATVGLAGCSTSSKPEPTKTAKSAAGPVSTLNVALGSIGTYDSPVILANTLGFAKADGLDITETVVGVNVLNIILAGQADVGQGGTASSLPAINGGKATKILYTME